MHHCPRMPEAKWPRWYFGLSPFPHFAPSPLAPQDRWLPLQGVPRGWVRVRLVAVEGGPESAAVRHTVAALMSAGATRGASPLLQVGQDVGWRVGDNRRVAK